MTGKEGRKRATCDWQGRDARNVLRLEHVRTCACAHMLETEDVDWPMRRIPGVT